jgi:hypothetical protein
MIKYIIACTLVLALLGTARAEQQSEYQLPPETTAYTESSSTDHLIGDTIARGLDIVLNPVYCRASRVYFWAVKPPTVRHVTIVTLQPEAAERQVQPDPQP